MSLLQNFKGIFKKHDELDLVKGFKAEYEAKNLENMKSIVDKKTWLDLPMRYQPYKKIHEKLLRIFLK